MAVFSIQEAESHFSELLERVVNGEEVVITKAGKPVAPFTCHFRSSGPSTRQ